MAQRAFLSKVEYTDIRAQMRKGDYYDETNHLCCGRCHTRKESTYDLCDILRRTDVPHYVTLAHMCDCEQAMCDELKRSRERYAQAARNRRYRAACFDSQGLDECRFDLDESSDTDASKVCRSYVEHFEDAKAHGHGMLLSGPMGTGKTFYAACVANALLDEGYRVRFTSLASCNSKISKAHGVSTDVIDALKACDLVVFDDLGVERNTSTANENAYQIVNALYQSVVCMVFTTNLSMRELAAATDRSFARVVSRITERCMSVNVTGGDRRQRVAKADFAFGVSK